jgi:hypothetical protein
MVVRAVCVSLDLWALSAAWRDRDSEPMLGAALLRRFDEVEHVVEVGLGVRRRRQTSL